MRTVDDLMALADRYKRCPMNDVAGRFQDLRAAIERYSQEREQAGYERGRTEREQDAEPVATADVINGIRAVADEAARRGEMYPQTSDEQREDKLAVRRVCGMLAWYENQTGCRNIKGWPTASPPKRKPLTEEQIKAIRRDCGWDDSYHFARAIERAHEIGDE